MTVSRVTEFPGYGMGVTSTLNSTTTPLSTGATYTGTGEQNHFPQVGVMVKTDNSGTLYFDFSNDGTNWDSTFPTSGFSVASGVSEFHTAVKLGRWFRVRLVNDTGAQTYLRLTTYYGSNFTTSNAPLNQTIGFDQDSIFTRGSIAQDEIRIGRRSGVEGWTKFAFRNNLTAAGGEEQIWATTGNFTPLSSAETFDITYNNTTDGNGTTGATELAFYYVDSNGNPAIATHTLGSTGSDTTTFSGFGINRVACSATGSNEVNGNDITISATTSATTQVIIPSGYGVTQTGIFFNGSNHYAIVKYIYIRALKTSGGASARIAIKGYVYNRGVSSRYVVFQEKLDTSVENYIEVTDPVGFVLNPTDVIYFVADTDTNNADIDIRFSLNQYQIN